jgi:hypothetical protein
MGQVDSTCDCYSERRRAKVGVIPTSESSTSFGEIGSSSSSSKRSYAHTPIPPGPITALNDSARLLPVTTGSWIMTS